MFLTLDTLPALKDEVFSAMMYKRNRIGKEEFMCERFGFKFNAQYVACLNVFSHLDDGEITIRGRRITPTPRKVVLVVAVNIVSHGALIRMRRERGKPAPVAQI